MSEGRLQPLFDAVPPVPSHAIVALILVVLGSWQVIAAKGTKRHRIVGWMFVIGMTYVALSALFISDLKTWGYFSPIHLLIPITLYSIWVGVRDVRRGDIKGHSRGMISLFVLAIVVTGAFTLMPGRIMHTIVFGTEVSGGIR